MFVLRTYSTAQMRYFLEVIEQYSGKKREGMISQDVIPGEEISARITDVRKIQSTNNKNLQSIETSVKRQRNV